MIVREHKNIITMLETLLGGNIYGQGQYQFMSNEKKVSYIYGSENKNEHYVIFSLTSILNKDNTYDFYAVIDEKEFKICKNISFLIIEINDKGKFRDYYKNNSDEIYLEEIVETLLDAKKKYIELFNFVEENFYFVSGKIPGILYICNSYREIEFTIQYSATEKMYYVKSYNKEKIVFELKSLEMVNDLKCLQMCKRKMWSCCF